MFSLSVIVAEPESVQRWGYKTEASKNLQPQMEYYVCMVSTELGYYRKEATL